MKQCMKCGKEYPALARYFALNKRHPTGLNPCCKECTKNLCNGIQSYCKKCPAFIPYAFGGNDDKLFRSSL